MIIMIVLFDFRIGTNIYMYMYISSSGVNPMRMTTSSSSSLIESFTVAVEANA